MNDGILDPQTVGGSAPIGVDPSIGQNPLPGVNPTLGANAPSLAQLTPLQKALLIAKMGVAKLGQQFNNRPRAMQQSGPQQGQGSPMSTPGSAPKPPGIGQPTNPYAQAGIGTLPMPSASPITPGGTGQPTPGFGAEFMQKLDPKGAATYNAIQGVSQVLQDWNSRKEQRQHSEAANVAQNLTQAIQNKDWAMVNHIMTDDHDMKILNKVYKGWLQKADQQKKDSQKQPEKQDPVSSGFLDGIQKSAQIGEGPQASQAQAQAPRQAGGYLLPQAGPAELTQGIAETARARQMAEDPGLARLPLTSEEIRQGALSKQRSEEWKYQAEIAKYDYQVKDAQLKVTQEEKKLELAQLKANEAAKAGQRALAIDDKRLLIAQYNADAAKSRADAARSRKQLLAAGKVPSEGIITKINASQKALDYVDQLLADKTGAAKGFTPDNVVALSTLLRQAGAAGAAANLPKWWGQHMPSWVPGGTGERDLQNMKAGIEAYRDNLQKTLDIRSPGFGDESDTSDTTPSGTGAGGGGSATQPPPEGGTTEGEGAGTSDDPIVINPTEGQP